jgi:hypothetical protein
LKIESEAFSSARPRESGDPKKSEAWIPACAGMSGEHDVTLPILATPFSNPEVFQ